MKILFAVDLSEPKSLTAAVASFANQLEAELFVLHVYVPTPAGPIPIDPMTGFGDMAYAVYDPAVQESIAQAEQTEFDEFLAARFDRLVRPALIQGDPARTILANADELEIDLIVMGKRRHGALERLLLGSVTQTVTRHAKRPVLLMPIGAEVK